MIYRISLITILGLLLFSCSKTKEKVEKEAAPVTKAEIKTYFSTEHIIEAEELLSISKQKHIKIIDFRKSKIYNKAHINGALNIWRTDIENNSYPYKGMMAKKEQIETLFSKLGIKNEDTLIVYDDRGACDAARLWWVLKNYNFESVKLLNGGLKAWQKVGGTTTAETVSIDPSEFTLPANSSFDLWIGKDEIMETLNSNGNDIILDTRNIDEFSGKRQKNGASKGGRIPKSILIDWSEAIDYNETHKFKSYDELENTYNHMKASKNDPIITYCHSGVRSAHTTFVLTELLGYKNVKNYDGSWVEWSYFKELPSEKDSITTIKK
ncbi:sulfurtransferase [Aquimarina sp. MMG016]|uniref:sulfurtransferase n=1 Tax=Aquimarina sp. MMG016 TaxID=2822690 RepID=UPI001B3A70AE|nr:sulfurtransferase [Aquimarina sp. MMG016]MBQ4819655.1 sulfurtransferase [Aquimarina sp. MMG016]